MVRNPSLSTHLPPAEFVHSPDQLSSDLLASVTPAPRSHLFRMHRLFHWLHLSCYSKCLARLSVGSRTPPIGPSHSSYHSHLPTSGSSSRLTKEMMQRYSESARTTDWCWNTWPDSHWTKSWTTKKACAMPRAFEPGTGCAGEWATVCAFAIVCSQRDVAGWAHAHALIHPQWANASVYAPESGGGPQS